MTLTATPDSKEYAQCDDEQKPNPAAARHSEHNAVERAVAAFAQSVKCP